LRGLRRCADKQRGIACLERGEAKVERAEKVVGTQRGIASLERGEAKVKRAEKVCWHAAWDSMPGERRSKS